MIEAKQLKNEWIKLILESMEENAGCRHRCIAVAFLTVDMYIFLNKNISSVKEIRDILSLSQLFAIYRKNILPQNYQEQLKKYFFSYTTQNLKDIESVEDFHSDTKTIHSMIMNWLSPSLDSLEIVQEKYRLEQLTGQPLNKVN